MTGSVGTLEKPALGGTLSALVAPWVVLGLLSVPSTVQAAVFGVPTVLSADGQVCTGVDTPVVGCTLAVDPPGYFILRGTAATTGDTVHQMRFFIEVTGTTLDVKVFDPGRNGARDVTAAGSTTTYTLLSPSATLATATIGSDTGAGTDNRLVRLLTGTNNPGFGFLPAGGTIFAVTPGLYELRVTESADAQLNSFGVDIRDGSGNHYNVYTIADSTAPASAWVGGTWGTGTSAAPAATIVQPMTWFAYVNRGCSIDTSNFDAGNPGALGSASILDALGNTTALTLSGNTVHSETTVTGEDITTTNYDATNYGMYRITHDTGSGATQNIVDWRVADYRGWADNPGALPRDPDDSIRMYLPNGYNPVTGNANAVFPQEPILQSGFRVVPGAGSANPPVVGSPTRVQITITLYNPGPGTISNLILQIPLPATGAALVAGTPSATLDGVATACQEAGGVPGFLAGSTTALQCTLTATVPVGSLASLQLQADLTPSALGLLSVTGQPSLAVTNITRAGTVATATTPQPHWFATGDSITIAGGSVAGYNITATITVTGPNSFTYTVPNAGGTSTGTITATENGTQNSAVALFTPPYSSTTARSESVGPICPLLAAVANSANLGVTKTKTAPAGNVPAGSNVTYSIVVSNAGPDPAPNASMTDPLPAGTTFVSMPTPVGWTCVTPAVGTNGTVSCSNPSLANGGSSTFTLVAQVSPGAANGSTFTNTASVASGAIDGVPGNNSASVSATVSLSAVLAITKTAAPDPVQALQNLTYTITITNTGPSNAATVTLADNVPANTTFQAISVPSGWTCPTVPAVNGTGAISCNVAAGLAAGSSARINLLVQVTGGATISNTATASTTTAPATPVSATATTTVGAASLAPTCATGDLGAGGTITGIVNTYYPGTATAATGATTITLGAATGSATPIAPGDLVLVVQMQDAAIDSNNDERYGDGTGTALNTTGDGSGSTNLNNAGLYEYVMATNAVPIGGGSLTIASALTRTYTTAAATATQGQRRFQVVRVPQYASASLTSGLTAGRWNGTSGGILAFDVTGALALGGAAVNVSGLGFRAGQGRALAGGTGTGTDYRNPAAQNVHASKGEGVAGTPRYLYSTLFGAEDTGIDGYPNGSSARGAPGNAGGGGTDSDPAANDENSGGGGGGNGGSGGRGGNTWRTNLPRGGWGGAVFTAAAARLALGGGGGAGTRNNSAGVDSSGGAGGALVMIRTNTMSGAGSITTDGGVGVEPDNDGGGGGGAGGTVLFLARGQANLTGLTINARGGQGTNAWPTQPPNGTPGERHGPGGGGAGGWVIVSGAPTAIVVTGALNGVTTTALDPFNATPGTGGQSNVALTDAAIPAFCPVTDVRITKTANPSPVAAGQTLTYTLTVGSLLTSNNVTVTDSIPATLSFVSAVSTRGTCSFTTPTLTCSLGTLLTGETATIDVVTTALVAAVPSVTNTATVTTTSTDVNAANNTSTVTTPVNPAADLAVTIMDTPDPVLPGQDITYTITVTNNGPSPAANPTLAQVSLPANTTFQSLTFPAGWTCGTVPVVGGTGAINCTSAAAQASGASVTFTLVVRVNLGTAPGTLITDTVTVATTTAETTLVNNSATAVTSLTPAAALLTRATIRGIRVDPAGLVEFATGSQKGTVSFNLYSTDDPSGDDRILLNPEPVLAPVSDSLAPLLYEVKTAPVTGRFLLVEETDRRGQRHMMGPFPVGDPRLAAAYVRMEKRLRTMGEREVRPSSSGRTRALVPTAEFRAATQARARDSRTTRLRPRLTRAGVKIEVGQPGRVSVTRDQLLDSGLPPGLPMGRLVLSNQGRVVPFSLVNPGTTGEALVFQAEGLSTTYTGQNVYLVTWTGAPRMGVDLTRDEAPAASGWSRINRHLLYAPDAPRGTDAWLWDVLVSDGGTWPENSWLDPQAGTFDLPNLPAGGSGAVPARLRVVGASDHGHTIMASINGQAIGSVHLEGREAAVIEGMAAGLLPVGNQLSIVYQTDDGSLDGLVLLDHLDLGIAAVPPASAGTVLDVSPLDPTLPDLTGVDYLIVTHSAFLAQAERLAGLKEAEGRRVAVVDVERAYDRFSAGIAEAQSVRALIQYAYGSGRLKFVLLVGDDTYDPQGFSGLGQVSFVPSLYGWDGEYGRVPSENRYADVDGDGLPDVAIGRLPVGTAAEADDLVAKIARQKEVLAAGAGRHLFAADNQSSPGETSFAAEAHTMASRLPQGSSVTWADLNQGTDAARAALGAGFAGSPSIVHYFGHGGSEVWADEDLLDVNYVALLEGSGSVVLTWACQVQDYQYIFGRSVNEALLMKKNGGALAIFGPAGIADAGVQAAFYERLYDTLLTRRTSLGEAVRRAKAAALAADPRVRPVVEGWNLLGDPSLVIEGLAPAPRGGR